MSNGIEYDQIKDVEVGRDSQGQAIVTLIAIGEERIAYNFRMLPGLAADLGEKLCAVFPGSRK